MKEFRINLGCGNDYRTDYVNCDYSPDVNADMYFNLENTLPFKDNTVSEILLNHVLEHTTKPIEVMKELYRISKNKARIKIRVPYFSSESAFSNITHYHQFTYTSFDLFDVGHCEHWQGCGNFKILYKKLNWRKQLRLFEWIFNIHPKVTRIYQELFCWWFPAKELEIELEVVKK